MFNKILFVCLLISPVAAWGIGNEMPKPVQNAVFFGPPFTNPVTLEFFSDETSRFDRLRTKYSKGDQKSVFGMLPVGITTQYRYADEDLLSFLRTRGFVKILTLRLSSSTMAKTYNFIGYTEKMATLEFLPGSHDIKLGHRVLKEITYEKNYTAEPFGVEIPVYSTTFNYTLESDTEVFPEVKSIFEGKVTAFKDPEDGKWKVKKIYLSDDGPSEYMKLVEQQVAGESE